VLPFLHYSETSMAEYVTETAEHLTDEQTKTLAIRLIQMLHGVPIGQALYVLTDLAPFLLKDGHVVDVTNHRFQAVQAVRG